MHQRQRVAVRIGEERHPQIVVIHLRDAMRRVDERHAAPRQLGNGQRDVGAAKVDAALRLDRPAGFFQQQPHARAIEKRQVAEAIEFPSFVPESMNLLQLLKSLQRQQRGLAVVLDEFGGTAGLITVEDILEEVIGQIRQEVEPEGDRPTPKNLPHRRRWRDIIAIVLLLAVIAGSWCYAQRMWNRADWQTPLTYKGPYAVRDRSDILIYSGFIRAARDGHFAPFTAKFVPELGAPFDGNWNDWPYLEYVPLYLIGVLARAVGIFTALNIF